MKRPLYQVDAFSDRVFRGNPAAVCPLEAWLPDEVLQSIAEENNLSETAFCLGKNGQYELRWFTPKAEVDLCGHATLATAHVLFEHECADVDEIQFQTRSGSLRVVRDGGSITMDFPAQPAEACEAPAGLVAGLGVTPVACLSAEDYLVVLESEDQVRALKPDFRTLSELDRRGVIVTAPGSDVDFVSRFFAPKVGIDEDPVTGSAHCTLAPYWAEVLGRNDLSARQCSERGGRLRCRLEPGRVWITGSAVTYLEGWIRFS